MAQQFRTRPDGSRYPITPKKVGVGGLAVTIGLTILVATDGLGAAAGPAGSAVSVEASLSVEQKARRSESRLRARLRPSSETTVQAASATEDCASVAYGRTRVFLEETPCLTVQRATVKTEVDGVGVVVPIAWVRMGSAESARALDRLVRQPETGSITPLDDELELSGQHFASRVEADLVTLAEAEPSSLPLPDSVLDEIAEVAAG